MDEMRLEWLSPKKASHRNVRGLVKRERGSEVFNSQSPGDVKRDLWFWCQQRYGRLCCHGCAEEYWDFVCWVDFPRILILTKYLQMFNLSISWNIKITSPDIFFTRVKQNFRHVPPPLQTKYLGRFIHVLIFLTIFLEVYFCYHFIWFRHQFCGGRDSVIVSPSGRTFT